MGNAVRGWAIVLTGALLAGCVAGSRHQIEDRHSRAAAPASVPYNAATTYAKLVKAYPFIKIAGTRTGAETITISGIGYARPGQHLLQLDLHLPGQATRNQGPLAAVVLVHGGGWRSGERSNMAPLAARLASRGIAAAVIDYRLADEARYPAAIHDVKAALRWLRANSAAHGIDPQRIAVAGGSAGGQIASLAGVTNGTPKFDPDGEGSPVSSAAQAVINIDGLSDFTSPAARANEDDPKKKPSAAGFWFGGSYAETAGLWREASPTFYVNRHTPPMLFIGSAQPRFAVGRDEMIEKMSAAGVATQVVMLPDSPHSFWLFEPWIDPTADAIAAFLHTHIPTTTRQAP
ncbi:alpha/beta hydrolase fold domain-containing protein [Massilia sp. CCM 8733]|uniref:Alpha/beta hydrolase fold domain-containing protein n=1 Tax=Massilia mucilaginosa TaxID=2609282 RepID=A0ABX0NVZ2_9BURK|nr:alpha/beta fold hydrolase [Massilia mucilaginosa]NHZ90896.1 alpha/beta hydrolase fold domain-containing protein [Massilia mucilaginosa]